MIFRIIFPIIVPIIFPMNHEFSLFVGVIQQHDVRSLLRLLGRAVTEDEVRSLMRGLDPLGDERLAWDTGPGRGS